MKTVVSKEVGKCAVMTEKKNMVLWNLDPAAMSRIVIGAGDAWVLVASTNIVA